MITYEAAAQASQNPLVPMRVRGDERRTGGKAATYSRASRTSRSTRPVSGFGT